MQTEDPDLTKKARKSKHKIRMKLENHVQVAQLQPEHLILVEIFKYREVFKHNKGDQQDLSKSTLQNMSFKDTGKGSADSGTT